MMHGPYVPSPRGAVRPVGIARRARRWLGHTAPLALLAGLVQLAGAAPAAAQGGTIAGTVVQAGALTPIPNAVVTVQGTPLGVSTDAAGRFRLTGVEGAQVTLLVRRIGFQPATQQARVGEQNVRIDLREKAVNLDAVVVTGTAGATEKRTIGNAISEIDVAAVTKASPAKSFQEIVNGRAAGVAITAGSGQVGTGSKIRIRGVSSLALTNDPLIYIDGVRVDNDQATGPANQAFGSSSISRWNDINPDEIESIEIIKGPAAATLYGTEAANGVIQIITKKGAAGAARWNFTMRQGANWVPDPVNLFWTNYNKNPTTGAIDSINVIATEKAAGRDVFRTGRLQDYNLSVSGGTDAVRYFVNGGFKQDAGAETSNRLKDASGRVNLSLRLSDRMNLAVNAGYTSGLTHLSAEAGYGGTVWSVVLADPNRLNTVRRGFYSGTPEGYNALYDFEQGINRFTGGVTMNYQPFGWLTQRLNLGLDQTREQNVYFQPRIDSLVGLFGSDALGLRDQTERNIRYVTLDYSGTASFNLRPSVTSATSVGAQYYRRGTDFTEAYGELFPAPGLSAVDATTQNRIALQDATANATVGFYVQEQLGWQNRRFLTLALRADDNSSFGENFDVVYYPKVSGSWIVSEESFWPLAFVNTLKLRAAYGESGQQPQLYTALRTYAAAVGRGDSPAISPLTIGNPDLGPERGREIEVGFDAGLLQDRLGLEFTYYRKSTVDAILGTEIAPSVGYPGTRFINAGEIRNSGIEILARARPVDRPNFGWDLSFNLGTNANKIVDLGIPGQDYIVPGSFLRHQEGYPAASWFARRVVSADFDPVTGKAINVMCDNGQGGSVACSEAPNVFLGRTTPSAEGAVQSSFTLFKRLRLAGMVDFKSGMKKMDGNLRVRCALNIGGSCRERYFPQDYDPVRVAQVQGGGAFVDHLITDASYAKLREISATFTLPERWVRPVGAQGASITLAGRNLRTWTKYGGLEPEAMFLGGSRGGGNNYWEQTTLPQLRSFVTTLNLTF